MEEGDERFIDDREAGQRCPDEVDAGRGILEREGAVSGASFRQNRRDGAELEATCERWRQVTTGQVRLERQKLSWKFAVLPGRLSTRSIFAPVVTLMVPAAIAWSATSELEAISHCSFEAEPKDRVLPKFIVPTPSPGASVPVTVVAAVRVPRPARVAPEATLTRARSVAAVDDEFSRH